MRASLYVFVLIMRTVGSVIAQENVASASQTSTASQAVTLTDPVKESISEASSASERHVNSIRSPEQSGLQRDHGEASPSVSPSFNSDFGNDQVSERAIDERINDRLGLFERADESGSGRYSASLDLEKEDSDWSFEVSVTIEF